MSNTKNTSNISSRDDDRVMGFWERSGRVVSASEEKEESQNESVPAPSKDDTPGFWERMGLASK